MIEAIWIDPKKKKKKPWEVALAVAVEANAKAWEALSTHEYEHPAFGRREI